MPENVNQQLFDKVVDLLFSIHCFHEQVLEMYNLPEDVRDSFLEWYGIVVDFLRKQRDILLSRLQRGCLS